MNCGLVAGWHRHRRRGEKPCQPCRTARNRYVAQWTRSRQGRKAPLRVDFVAVEMTLTGAEMKLGLHERRVAIPRLRSQGLSPEAIARRVNCHPRTVERHLSRSGQ